MKVVSVVKRAAVVASIGASMYLSPSHAQYVLDPLYITSTNSCWYWSSCGSAPEIPGYIWTSWGGVGYYSPIGGGGGGSSSGSLGANLATSLQLRDTANKKFDDRCYYANEDVSAWMSRVVLEVSRENKPAVTEAVRHIVTVNAGATSFTGLLGYSDNFTRPSDLRYLNPRPC